MKNFFCLHICWIIIFLQFFIISCSEIEKKESIIDNRITKGWYKQSGVELGNRITMLTPNYGYAISRGRGDIPGNAYRFKDNRWQTVYEFPYSDYPSIVVVDSSTTWFVIHQTHRGHYRPRLYEIKEKDVNEIKLPSLMWDDVDYVMFSGLSIYNDKGWMVGQQGNILHYNRSEWNSFESPIQNIEKINLRDGDLFDVQMLSEKSGWAVGRNGLILRYKDNQWEKFPSPVTDNLHRISMANENFGWIVGDRGTILQFNGNEWNQIRTEYHYQFTSVKTIDEKRAWITGRQSVLLEYIDDVWVENPEVKNLYESFADVDVIIDSLTGEPFIWLMGSSGIYTNYKSIGVSFTDITNSAALTRSGRGGIFFDINGNNLPDLLLISEDSQNLFFENIDGIRFEEITGKTNIDNALNNPLIFAVGDINNDGYQDYIELIDEQLFRVYLGRGNNQFIDFTEQSNLTFEYIEPFGYLSITLVDLNNNGSLDLYVSNYNHPDKIFLNDGAGKFTKAENISFLEKTKNYESMGPIFGDFTNNGFTDILISDRTNINVLYELYKNNGNLNFELIEDSSRFLNSAINPLTLAWTSADFNNDGYLDFVLYTLNFPPFFMLNNGDGTFKDVTKEYGFTEVIFHPEPINGIIAAGDINNDGWIDLFIGSRLYKNQDGKKFIEITDQVGIDFTGNPSFADIDNDGDIDLFIGSSRFAQGAGDRTVLYRNNLNNKNFLKVQVNGDVSNRSGINTKLYLKAFDKENNHVHTSLKILGTGGSPLIQSDLTSVHFGINPSLKYKLEAIFPSGKKQVVENIEAGSFLVLNESTYFVRIFNHVSKSFKRTFQLLDIQKEILKLLLFLFLFLLFIFFGRKTKAKNIVSSLYTAAGLLLLYLLLTHLTILDDVFTSILFTYLPVTAVGILVIVLGDYAIKKKEEKYVSHFKIIELLGAGGMGKVYKAVDIHTKSIVALKLLNPDLLKDAENKKRLAAEGRLLSSFLHPNIIKVYEIGESSEKSFIAMEYLTGGTLSEYLQNNYPIPEERLTKIILQICEGMNEIHKQEVIHRDLKTGNIMLDGDGSVRIMDFGLSKSPLVSTMTSLGTVIGTLGYVAPEQITNLNVDPRTDIFSFGVMLYELLTNVLPFRGENEIALIHSIFNTLPSPPSSINDNINNLFDEITMKCISKNPEERFSSFEEISKQFSMM